MMSDLKCARQQHALLTAFKYVVRFRPIFVEISIYRSHRLSERLYQYVFDPFDPLFMFL